MFERLRELGEFEFISPFRVEKCVLILQSKERSGRWFFNGVRVERTDRHPYIWFDISRYGSNRSGISASSVVSTIVITRGGDNVTLVHGTVAFGGGFLLAIFVAPLILSGMLVMYDLAGLKLFSEGLLYAAAEVAIFVIAAATILIPLWQYLRMRRTIERWLTESPDAKKRKRNDTLA